MSANAEQKKWKLNTRELSVGLIFSIITVGGGWAFSAVNSYSEKKVQDTTLRDKVDLQDRRITKLEVFQETTNAKLNSIDSIAQRLDERSQQQSKQLDYLTRNITPPAPR